MELPITVVFEPPSLGELRAVVRRRRLWVAAAVLALAIGIVLVVAGVSHVEAQAAAGGVPIVITSAPAGALVMLDGQQRGRTPAQLQVPVGRHRVALRSDDALEADYVIDAGSDGGVLDARLWRREPSLRRVRPSLPGAVLERVFMLPDGQLALVTRAAVDAEQRAWRLDPSDGAIEPIYAGVPGSTLAVAADGNRLAYIGREIGPPSASHSVTVEPPDGAGGVIWRIPDARVLDAAPQAVWRTPAGETLVDLSWSPVRDNLLVVTGTALRGGVHRSRLWLVDANADESPRALLTLPSAVVSGTHAWSPDGRQVVFVARAGLLNALCLLDLHGNFRYLADLERSDAPPLPFPPVAWSNDSQRVAFVAPHQHPPSPAQSWLTPPPGRAVYVADVGDAEPRLIAQIDAETAAWREDGSLVLATRRAEDSTLGIHVLGSDGQLRRLLEVPLRLGARSGIAFHMRSGQVLVANVSGFATEFWVIGLSAERRT